MLSLKPLERTTCLIGCEVGQAHLALERRWIRGIDRAEWTRPADSLDVSVGEGEEAGRTYPVYSLGRLLDLAPESEATLLRLGDHATAFGLLVDRVTSVLPSDEAGVFPLPCARRSHAASYFHGIAACGDAWRLVLDPSRLSVAWSGQGITMPLRSHTAPASASLATTAGRLIVFPAGVRTDERRPLSLALSMVQLREILPPVRPTVLPTWSADILGVVGWRGRPIPVVDLARLLGPTDARLPAKESHLLIATTPEHGTPLAFPVNRPLRLLRLPLPHGPSQRPLPLRADLIRGAVELPGETLAFPDLEAILQEIGDGE